MSWKTYLQEGLFSGFKKAFKLGQHLELYNTNPKKFVKMLEPFIDKKDAGQDVYFGALKNNLAPENKIEVLQPQIEAMIKKHGGLKAFVKKMGK